MLFSMVAMPVHTVYHQVHGGLLFSTSTPALVRSCLVFLMSVSFHLAGTLIDLLDVEPTVETSPLHQLPVPWERTVMPTMRVECC